MVVNLFEINIGSLCLIVSDDSVDFVEKANQFFLGCLFLGAIKIVLTRIKVSSVVDQLSSLSCLQPA
ncbi:hypothetical protein PMIT1306_01277 [Prochlorococcus sp. MIT 1306]|nr:hypothetical protein PMIT1306_01277 [Prochlorococcus sp. MIT 1306]